MKVLRILPLFFMLAGCVSFNNTTLTSLEPSTQLQPPQKKLEKKAVAESSADDRGVASTDL